MSSQIPAGQIDASSRAPAPGVARRPGGMNPTMPGMENPYALADAFHAYHGPMPTHQIVSNMENGQTPQPPGALAATTDVGPAANAVPAATSSPQEAGQLNSLDPGHFTGHPANGYPAEEEGHDKSSALRGGPQGAPQPGMEKMPQVTPGAPDAGRAAREQAQMGLDSAKAAQNAPQPKPAPQPGTPPVPTPTPPAPPMGAPPQQAQEPAAAPPPDVAAPAVQPPTGNAAALAQGPQVAEAQTTQDATRDPTAGPTAGAGETAGQSRESASPGPAAAGQEKTKPVGATLAGDGTFGSGIGTFGLFGHPAGEPDVAQPHSTTNLTSRVGSWTQVPEGTAPSAAGSYNSQGYVNNKGKLEPWTKAQWEGATGPNKVDPVAFIQSNPTNAMGSVYFWTDGMGFSTDAAHNLGRGDDPATHQVPSMVTGTKGLSPAQLAQYTPFQQNLITKTQGLMGKYDELSRSNPGADGQASVDAQKLALGRQIQVGLAGMHAYGIDWQGGGTQEPAAGGGPGGTDNVVHNDNPDTVHDGQPNNEHVGDTDNSGGSTSNIIPGPGGGGHVADNFAGTNLEASDLMASAVKGDIGASMSLAGILPGGGTPEGKRANFELIQQFIKDRNAQNDKQSGLNLIGNAAGAMQNDPNRARATDLVTGILKNPDPTDWEKVKNQSVAASDATMKAGNDQLSLDLARRGLSAEAGAGAAGELNRQHAGDVATRLGDLDIQQSKGLRAAQENAIAQENQAYQLYNVGDYNTSRDIAGFLANPAQPGQSPAAGFLNADLGIKADGVSADAASQAADDAKRKREITAATTAVSLLALMV